MKKIFSLLILSALVLNVFAKGSPVKFVKGDFSVLKNPANEIVVELDMSKVKLSDSGKSWNQFIKDSGSDYVRDWPDEKKKLESYFWVMYNKKNKKGAQVHQESKTPAYKIIVRPGEIDLGSRAAAAVSMFVTPFAKGGECVMKSCEIEVVKTTTTTKSKGSKKGSKTTTSITSVCVYSVDEMKGSSSMSETIRIGTILTTMGKKFGKLVATQ